MMRKLLMVIILLASVKQSEDKKRLRRKKNILVLSLLQLIFGSYIFSDREYRKQKKRKPIILPLLCIIAKLSTDSIPVKQRLFAQPSIARWLGRDVYRIFSRHRYEFFRASGETLESFNDLFDLIHTAISERTVGSKLSPVNKLLMVLLWLRNYPTYILLSLIFEIDESSVCRIINEMWRILYEYLSPGIV